MPTSRFDSLTAAQQEAVDHKEGPLLVIAGPGSGKTRVITCRIASLIHSGVAPARICAITFTNKAAEEMRQRAVALGASAGAWISTFHALCVRILRRYADQAGIRSHFSIFDTADQTKIMRQAAKESDLDTTQFPPARLLGAVSMLKNKLTRCEDFTEQAQDFFSITLARVYTRYQALMAEQNALDFDDLLVKTAFLLEGDNAVDRELSERFQFLLIDEYQDTNHAQYRIAKALARHHGNICATGDPDQSIYRWRGADIRNILDFEQDWPDARIVRLEENFRSTANILQAADNVITHNRFRKSKRLIPTKEPGEAVVVADCEDEVAEAETVAQGVSSLIGSGVSPNQIAVFYRVNAISRTLEESLISHKVPYQVVRGVEFYNRKEIKDLLTYLKVLVNPDDETALLRIINTPARGIGRVTIERLKDAARARGVSLWQALTLVSSIESLSNAVKGRLAAFVHILEPLKNATEGPVAPILDTVFVASGLEAFMQKAGADGREAIENITELINGAARYDELTPDGSLLDYLQQISLFSDTDVYDAESERVVLMSLHAAKGLEFDHVFIVGLEEGLLPHERSSDDEHELEEERRLFFVGMTRARCYLHITYARYRHIRGQVLRTVPSPFLGELGIGYDTLAYEGVREPKVVYDTSTSQAVPEFITGQLVRHERFGLGRVQDFLDMGDNSTVTIRFNTGQTRTLMLKYAHLVKVEGV